MKLQTRTLLMVTFLLIVTVLATATVLTWTARNSLLAQTEAEGILIAQLLGRSAGFALNVANDVEAAIGEQMIVEATIAAHLVAIAEAAGLGPDKINAHLRNITDHTVLDEFWITDRTGHAYLRNIREVPFTFSPDPEKQPQAHVFWPLLTGEQSVVIQDARIREVDTQVFKYAGVGGIDKPRIVQVGYHASFIEQLRAQVGLSRLVDELVAGGNVNAIQIVDRNIVTVAYSAVPGLHVSLALIETDASYLRTVVSQKRTMSYQDGISLKVMAPITDPQGNVAGATLVYLPTDHVRAAVQRNLQLGVLVAAWVLVAGLLASVVLTRWVTGPVSRLTAAAAAMEAETFEAEDLAEVAERPDELGQLARVFQRMAREVRARAERLKRQVQELLIEIDEVKKERQVAEITDTEYFLQLQEKARRLRAKSGE